MLPHLGPTELLLILLIVIIIFGAGKLPEIGGALGKGIKEFRSATKDEEAKKQKELAAAEAEAKKDEEKK
jgi:sec-independent protein translocase protein TatA